MYITLPLVALCDEFNALHATSLPKSFKINVRCKVLSQSDGVEHNGSAAPRSKQQQAAVFVPRVTD